MSEPDERTGEDPNDQLEGLARIQRAIVEVVVEHGYTNANLEMVLERAAVDPATFERHFADFEDCFCVVLEEQRDRFLAAALLGFASERGWRDQIRSTAYAMLDRLSSDIDRARFVFVEMLAASDRAQLIRDQGMELLFDLIDAGREELDDPSSMTRATAEAVGGAIYNRMHVAIATAEARALAELVPKLMYSVVLPYLGPDAALDELTRPRPPST